MYRTATLALTAHDANTLLLLFDLADTLPGGLTPAEARLKQRLVHEKERTRNSRHTRQGVRSTR